MSLAVKEMRRRPSRFAAAAVILTLIAWLLVFLGALLDGLVGTSVAAIKAQRADMIVYSADANASFFASRIDPVQRGAIEAVDGVVKTGGIGVAQLAARLPGNDPRDVAAVALFGVEIPPRGLDALPGDGDAVADTVLRDHGAELGDRVLLGPARTPVRIVGFVNGTTYLGVASLWTTASTWRKALADNQPALQMAGDTFQALLVTGSAEPATVDAATDHRTRSLTIAQAADRLPGVPQQRSVIGQIIATTLAAAAVIVAMFFTLITVERAGQFALLKALGADSSSLIAGVVTQATIVTGGAGILGGGLAALIAAMVPPSAIPLELGPGRLALSGLLLFAAALVGCLLTLRRILRADPAAALGALQ